MPEETSSAEYSREEDSLKVVLSGRLDAGSVAEIWEELKSRFKSGESERLVIDASGVDYCDGSGAALLVNARRLGAATGRETEIRGLRDEIAEIVDLFGVEEYTDLETGEKTQPASFPEQVGLYSRRVWLDFLSMMEFIGECAVSLRYAIVHPRTVRWKDALRTAETAGVNAFPVVALIGFLVGFVIAFQSANPLSRLGGEIFIPSLVGVAILRELGPVMTAYALAGRSSSAFAAEIGTMKVNEEISALITFGLKPVSFLVVPRVIAAVVMTPILTVFGNIAGLLGAMVVFCFSLGYSPHRFISQLTQFAEIETFLSGMGKSLAFGLIVGGVGCLRGLQTKTGASAVGHSTTSAVVTSIVLITFTDGVFAVVYYVWGI